MSIRRWRWRSINKDKVESAIDKYMAEVRQSFVWRMELCESPVEKLMFVALERCRKTFDFPADSFYWELQHNIPGTRFRVDFLVSMLGEDGSMKQVVVECDGHDFHEKTKEQAKKDKQRDRALTRMGLPLLHFTGSEIWRDADKCAHEVMDFLYEQAFSEECKEIEEYFKKKREECEGKG